MIDEKGIIKSPVSNIDVANTLGVGTLDVGELCTSDRINKWSRLKPMNIPKYDVQWGEWDSFTGSIEALHRFGFKYLDYLISADPEIASKKRWELLPPDDYYRLTDFDGYFHAAKPLMEVVNLDGKNIYGLSAIHIVFMVGNETGEQLSILSIGNFFLGSYFSTFANWHCCIVVLAVGEFTPYYFINPDKPTDGSTGRGYSLPVDVPPFSDIQGSKEFDFYYLMTNLPAIGPNSLFIPGPIDDNMPVKHRVTLSNDLPVSVEILEVSNSITGTFFALSSVSGEGSTDYLSISKATGAVYFKVRIQNLSSEKLEFPSSYIYLNYRNTFHGINYMASVGYWYDLQGNMIPSWIEFEPGETKVVIYGNSPAFTVKDTIGTAQSVAAGTRRISNIRVLFKYNYESLITTINDIRVEAL